MHYCAELLYKKNVRLNELRYLEGAAFFVEKILFRFYQLYSKTVAVFKAS